MDAALREVVEAQQAALDELAGLVTAHGALLLRLMAAIEALTGKPVPPLPREARARVAPAHPREGDTAKRQ